MEKLKVLTICQEDPQFLLGGMGRHLRELFRAMAERDDVEIDMLVGGPINGSIEYKGFTKHHCDKLMCYKPKSLNMGSLLMADIQMIRTLTKLIASGKKWDLVHVHEWNSIQVARIARDALNIPMIGTMHLCITKLMMDDFKESTKYSEADIYLMQQEGHLIIDPNELILCSKAYEKLARELFMTDRYINVIENGIRTEEWQKSTLSVDYIRNKFNLPNRPIALFVGRIAEMKGIVPLINSITKGDSGYCIVLAGEVNANSEEEKEGWDITRKIRSTERNYPDRLKWVGFQEDSNLKELYSIAEIGLMPSSHEPFGIVALEFMSMGIPLICTEVDGLKEIIVNEQTDEEYALIIDPNNSYQIHQAMKFLKENKNIKNELSILGKKRVKDFDWHVVADKTVKVYRKLLRRFENVERIN